MDIRELSTAERLLLGQLQKVCDRPAGGYPCDACGEASILHSFKKLLAASVVVAMLRELVDSATDYEDGAHQAVPIASVERLLAAFTPAEPTQQEAGDRFFTDEEALEAALQSFDEGDLTPSEILGTLVERMQVTHTRTILRTTEKSFRAGEAHALKASVTPAVALAIQPAAPVSDDASRNRTGRQSLDSIHRAFPSIPAGSGLPIDDRCQQQTQALTPDAALLEALAQQLENQASDNGCYGEVPDGCCVTNFIEPSAWCPYCLMGEASKRLRASLDRERERQSYNQELRDANRSMYDAVADLESKIDTRDRQMSDNMYLAMLEGERVLLRQKLEQAKRERDDLAAELQRLNRPISPTNPAKHYPNCNVFTCMLCGLGPDADTHTAFSADVRVQATKETDGNQAATESSGSDRGSAAPSTNPQSVSESDS